MSGKKQNRSKIIGLSLTVKNLPANAGDVGDAGLILGLGKSPGEGNGNSPQYSSLRNSMDRGAWRAYSPWGREESDMTELLSTTETKGGEQLLKPRACR